MTNAATTLQGLITQVRQRTMTEYDQFTTDAEITTMLNASLSFLDSILKQNDDYQITSVIKTISNVATPYFTVPADFFKVRSVEIQSPVNAGQYVTLEKFNLRTQNKYNNFPFLAPIDWATGACNMRYRPEGAGSVCKIFIQPAQFSAYTYQLWYTPTFLNLVNTTDALPAYMDTNAWCEYAVSDVCAKMKEKEGLDATPFMARAMDARNSITSDSSTIDRGSVVVIEDVRDGDGADIYGSWNY